MAWNRKSVGEQMMYRIDFETMREAMEILYCFMTLPLLNDPECTIWSDSGFPDTITNTGSSFMTDYLVLNFPPLNGKINPNEKTFLFALFKMLRDTK